MTNQLANFTFAVSPEASVSIHDNGIVILDARSGGIFSSNAIGACIWRRIEQQLSTQAITEEISNEYGLAHSVAHGHLTRFLGQLEQHELIERESAL
jgi:hypothetical protein